jgi:hypothetical protein
MARTTARRRTTAGTGPETTTVSRRQAVLRALDPMVRRLLRRRVGAQVPAEPVLTVYEAVYPALPAEGGHWTLAAAGWSWFGTRVRSYAVALRFDRRNRPQGFRIRGAREVVTPDASEAALAAGLAEAAAAGPEETATPTVFPTVGL